MADPKQQSSPSYIEVSNTLKARFGASPNPHGDTGYVGFTLPEDRYLVLSPGRNTSWEIRNSQSVTLGAGPTYEGLLDHLGVNGHPSEPVQESLPLKGSEVSEKGQAALWNLERFGSVFPLKPNTKGGSGSYRSPSWKDDAFTAREQVIAHWTRYPDDNIGVPASKNHWVLDVDPRHGGDKSVEEHEVKYGKLPETFTVQTSGGGHHYYFSSPNAQKNASGDFAPGLDTRTLTDEGNLGYVVGVGSIRDGNQYRVVRDVPLVPAPVWLLDLIKSVKNGSESSKKSEIEMIPEGERNNRLASLAGALRNQGLDEEGICEALDGINRSKCSPPLPDDEVRAIAHSVASYESGSAPTWKLKGGDNTIITAKGTYRLETKVEEEKVEWVEPPEMPNDHDLEGWKQRANERIASLSRPRAIHEDFFHGPVGNLCRAIQASSDVDPIAVGAQCLTILGSIYGRNPRIYSGGKFQRPNLMLGIIGPTTLGRKGSGLGVLLDSIFQRLDNEWLENCVERGLTTGEGMIGRIRDPRTVDEDDGEDGLEKGDKDPGVEDKRVLFLAEELPSILHKAKKRNDGSLFGTVCEGFDSPNFMSVTTKKGALRATGPHISIIGHGTVNYLNKAFDITDIAGGFCNRFLWIWSTMTQALLDAKVPEMLLIPFFRDASDAIKFAEGVQEMTRTDEAQRLMEVEYYKSIATAPTGLLGDLLAREVAIVNRLSIIFALTDCSDIIKVEHIKVALALWNYSANCAALIFSGKLDGLEDKILRILRQKPTGLTRTQIWKDLAVAHTKSTTEVLKALEVLEKASLAKREGSGKGEKWFPLEVK